jgi:hypothetical protein
VLRASPVAERREIKRFPCVLRHNGATLAPSFGNTPFTMTGKTARGFTWIGPNGGCAGLAQVPP